MRSAAAAPTGREATFGADEIIVSKTDARGKITYANRVFQRISGYREAELIGQPHSIIRHPDMPRIVFKRLWETIAAGRELFAYVVNLGRDGSHYWVFAHVTPTFGPSGEIVGYHSNRRCPRREALAVVEPFYRMLLGIERAAADRAAGLAASAAAVDAYLAERGVEWDELMIQLETTRVAREAA